MISVCMATYNGARFIARQLESILSQLPCDAEVVVADDGSTDETLEIIRGFDDPRIRVLAAATHLGPVYNFQRSLEASRGELIFLADQDDVWHPEKVRRVQEALAFDGKKFPPRGPWLLIHDAALVEGSRGSLPSFDSCGTLKNMWTSRPYRRGVLRNWIRNSYTGCCMAFRRDLLKVALPFPEKLPMHDQWLGLLAERMGGVVALPEILMLYRLHENNATHLVGGKSAGMVQRLKWRWNLLKGLLRRDAMRNV